MFRGSVKSTGYPLHSPVSPSTPLPCVTVCHHISTGLYVVYEPRTLQIAVNSLLQLISSCKLRAHQPFYCHIYFYDQLAAETVLLILKITTQYRRLNTEQFRHVRENCEKRVLVSPCLSVCPSVWQNSAANRRISIKFATSFFLICGGGDYVSLKL